MKKVFLIMLFLPTFAFPQKIISDKNEVKELHSEAGKYTKIIVETAGFSLNVLVSIDDGGIWHFLDSESNNNKKFKTDIEVLNFMAKNGWLYKEQLNTGIQSNKSYLFEKVDTISKD